MAGPSPHEVTAATFDLGPGTAAEVRSFLAETTRLDPMRAAEAALLVTEVVANAYRHGAAEEIEVTVAPHPPSIRVAVAHPSRGPLGEVEPGFGLTLLEALAKSWGHRYRDGELEVWFEVRAPGASVVPDRLTDEDLLARMEEDPLYGEELVRRHQDLALSIARRFRGKGIATPDLEQAALVGLLKAVRRYDPARGDLASYAAVTISGEMKRLLRDRAWSVRVPRSLQERALEVGRATQRLTQALGRPPRLSELAEELGLGEEEVAEAISVRLAYSSSSLDAPAEETGLTLLDRVAEIDEGLADVEHRGVVDEALLMLPERERLIVYLRFYQGMTQSEIAEVVGVSQMHVSRLLTRSLAELRQALADTGH